MKKFFFMATTALVLIGLLVVPACGGNGNGNGVTKYNLTMLAVGSGTTSPSGTTSVDEASTVNIVATPAEGWEFVGWTSAPAVTFTDATSRTTSFTMPSNAVTVTATFEEGCPEGDITFVDGKIRVGIAGELAHMTGQFSLLGATLAQGAIGGMGGVVVDGKVLEIALVPIETGEATVSPGGTAGFSQMLAKIDDVDFILGGFRSEAVFNYREVAVGPDGAGKIFFNCGAATEALQNSVVTDYDDYKYWFKTTPYNEYFLAQTVVRNIDAIGRQIRDGIAEDPDYTLRAVMIHDDAVWAEELVGIIEGLLDGINVDLVAAPVPVDPLLTDTTWIAILGALAPLDPHFYIPILSADAGVAFAGYRKAVHLNAMAVGINVPGQFKSPWAADLGKESPGGPNIRFDVLIDTWAEEAAVTPMTLPFFNAFVGFAGDYPLYTAATYDAMFGLKEAIEATAWYCEDEDTLYADTDDIITWFEDLENARLTTTGTATFYPLPEGETSGGKPTLSEAQVSAIYPHVGTAGYPAYNAADWTMPAHTTHDIVYGPDYLTGMGAQWQWDEVDGVWKKYCVWPAEIEGADMKDQYGDWNFEYTGTKPVFIFPGAIKP